MGLFSIFKKNEKPTRLEPESQVHVGFDDDKIWCTGPGGPDQTMLWAELIGVAIKTTDEGPFAPDVFWILGAKDKVLIYPGGATGEQDMLSRLQQLPGFNSNAVIEAATCTDNDIFICWDINTHLAKEDGQRAAP